MTSTVQSAARSLQDLIAAGYRFRVPRYQRLYVWEAEQVNTLVDDLLTAASTPRRPYYLGSILLVRQPPTGDVFDLIDGQQRLTTLWLLSLALGREAGAPLAAFAAAGSAPRLTFAIRAAANAYFQAQLRQGEPPALLPEHRLGLRQITQAYELIKHRLAQAFPAGIRSAAARQFGQFVRRQVRLIVTEVPVTFDLTRLFEALNNRGAQLQHHEILKSRLLSWISSSTSLRGRYAKLWNACANTDDYLERNLAREAQQPLAGWYDESAAAFHVKELLPLLGAPAEGRARRPVRLNQVLAGKAASLPSESADDYEKEEPGTAEDEQEAVRSILSFPQLLLHTLRIFLFRRKLPDLERINEKELLQAFTSSGAITSEATARQFVELLWQVRQGFDLFVIKWVKTSTDEIHAIKRLRKHKPSRRRLNYLHRDPSTGHSGLELLQSMLYHSQQITTQYWLTPFLDQALRQPDSSVLYEYLKRLDNQLFCTGSEDNLVLRTRQLLGQNLATRQLPCSCDYLDQGRGVHFAHYWFYKLDFVLWHELFSQRQLDERWRAFRFTAKNSVEHVSPQKPRPEDLHTLTNGLLDDFGNLALVSRSINSEAGNKAFLLKRQEFGLKPRLDSLKSALIYEHRQWNDKRCVAHREQMKAYLRTYFASHA
ncbi:MAG TPA: DUF262 domain-containing HNH endonuclease family protein [Hymenobacter sp.]|uniref:DUF262 domain-containing protein n=1 Tax=Hymenobacter sp. TaxID=1898978 RepID=UPI002ED960B2